MRRYNNNSVQNRIYTTLLFFITIDNNNLWCYDKTVLPLQQLQMHPLAGRHTVQPAEGRSNHILNMLC